MTFEPASRDGSSLISVGTSSSPPSCTTEPPVGGERNMDWCLGLTIPCFCDWHNRRTDWSASFFLSAPAIERPGRYTRNRAERKGMRRAAAPDVPDQVNEESWEQDRPSAPVLTLVASKVVSKAGRHPERSYRSWYATW